MKTTIKTLLLAIAATNLIACGQQPVQMMAPQTLPQVRIQQNTTQQFIIKFKPEAHRMALQVFSQKYNLKIVDMIPQINAYVVEMPTQRGIKLQQTLSAMQNEGIVNYVEKNMDMRVNPVYDMRISPIIN